MVSVGTLFYSRNTEEQHVSSLNVQAKNDGRLAGQQQQQQARYFDFSRLELLAWGCTCGGASHWP